MVNNFSFSTMIEITLRMIFIPGENNKNTDCFWQIPKI